MAVADRDLAGLALQRLREVRDRDGGVTEAHVRQVAEAVGCSRATVYRWLAAGELPSSPRRRFEVADVHLDAYFAASGSAAAAYRALAAQGERLPSPRTFERALRRQLSPRERARARMGEEGERRLTVYVPRREVARNYTWEADHKQLDVLVRPRVGARPVKPWLTAVIDTYSRAVMGYAVSLIPDRGVVLAALSAAMRPDEARAPFCGRPRRLRCDHGLEFAAAAVRQAAVAIGFEVVFAPEYMPHRKGKIERLHSTIISELLIAMPFFTKGPRRADGSLAHAPVRAEPMTLKALVAELDEWVGAYNLRRAHRGLGGQTPLERWNSDATAIEHVEAAGLRRLLLEAKSKPVTSKGVSCFGGQYLAPELNALCGETVEVRFMPNDERSIEIYFEERWVCTALPPDLLTDEDREQHVRRRQADAERARRHERAARRAARVRLAAMTEPGEPVVTTVVRAAGDRLGAQRSARVERAEAEAVRRLRLRMPPAATEER